MLKYRLISAALVCTFLFSICIPPSFLYSRSLEYDELSSYLGASPEQYYLQSAESFDSRSQWIRYAKTGLVPVISSWEKEILHLANDNNEIEIIKHAAAGVLDKKIKELYSEWLVQSFFSDINVPGAGDLSTEIDNLNKLYLYDTAADGNLRYKDSEGYSDVFITGEDGQRILAEKGERRLWAEGVRAKISELLKSWDDRMTTSFSEIKSAVSDEDALDCVVSDYKHDLKTFRENYSEQLLRLYMREQSRFVNLRLYDQYSLEHESKKETASSLTDRIIGETRKELESSLAVFKTEIETSADSESSPDGVYEHDWRDAFQKLLDDGLSSWDSAEEELLMQRISWEQDAGAALAGGEKIWAEAFLQLESSRADWMNEFKNTLEDGSRVWSRESQNLDEAVEKAMAEIDSATAETGTSLSGRIDNLTGMLVQSLNMMHTAREGWEYWLERCIESVNSSVSVATAGRSPAQMKAVMEQLYREGAYRTEAAWKEAEYWLDTYGTYYAESEDSQRQLAETYGIVVFNENGIQTGLAAESILSAQRPPEGVYLDDFQAELFKARACRQYWERQNEIAYAVFDYAADNSSSRESAGQTVSKLENALSAYEAVFSEYTNHLNSLSELSSRLENIQDRIGVIRGDLADYQTRLTEAREEYARAIADLEIDDSDYLSEEFTELFNELLQTSGLSEEAAETPESLLEDFTKSAAAFQSEKLSSSASAKIVELINGSADYGESINFHTGLYTVSLPMLYEGLQKLSQSGFSGTSGPEDACFNPGIGGEDELAEYLAGHLLLEMDDYRYGMLLEYYSRYALAGKEEKGRLLWRMQRIVDDLEKECNTAYELRLAELKLLSCDDISEWKSEYSITETSVSNTESVPAACRIIQEAAADDVLVYREIINQFKEKGEEPFVIYDWSNLVDDDSAALHKSQALQLIWEHHRKQYDDDESAAAAVSYIAVSLEKIADWAASLNEDAESQRLLEQAATGIQSGIDRHYLKSYLDGRHNLLTDYGDMYDYIYSDKQRQRSFSASLSECYERNSDYAFSLSEYSFNNARIDFINTFSELELYDEARGKFFGPEEVWSFYKPDSIEDAAEVLYKIHIQTMGLKLPDHIAVLADNFIDGIDNYFAIKSAVGFEDDYESIDEVLQQKIDDQFGKISSTTESLNYLKSNKDIAAGLLRIAETAALPEELKQTAAKRYIETAAFRIAFEAAETEDFNNEQEQWTELLEGYADSYQNEIILYAEEVFDFASELNSEQPVCSGKYAKALNAMVWNSLDFEEAAEQITGSESKVDLDLFEELKSMEAGLAGEAEALIDAQFPGLSELSALGPGNVYADILACNLAAALIEKKDYEEFEAVEFVNWLFSAMGSGFKLETEFCAEFMAAEPEDRLAFILNEHPDAAQHFLKKKIITEGLSSADSDELISSFSGLTSDTRDSLRLTAELQQDLRSYSPLLHGNFEKYLDLKYSDEDIKRRQREVYLRFRGNPSAEWDDPVFLPAFDHEADTAAVISVLAYNKTGDFSGDLTVNEIFINEAVNKMNDTLYRGEASLTAGLEKLLIIRDLLNNSSAYTASLDTVDHDNWRSFIDENPLLSGFKETSDIDTSEDDRQNFIIDASSVYSKSSEYVAAAVEVWTASEASVTEAIANLNKDLGSGQAGNLVNHLSGLSEYDIRQLYSCGISENSQNDYTQNKEAFLVMLEKIRLLKSRIGEMGRRRERLVRLANSGAEAQTAELKPIGDLIDLLENKIQNSTEEWNALLEGPEGYRNIEADYSILYEETSDLFENLEQARHEYSIASAVYDYAFSGYLQMDSNLTESYTVEPAGFELNSIANEVSPEERLNYSEEQLMRASAVCEVLEQLYEGNAPSKTVFQSDEKYRVYFEKYTRTYKETLLLNRMNTIINEALASQQQKTRKAFSDWRKILNESFSIENWSSGFKAETYPSELSGLNLEKKSDGEWQLSWNKPASSGGDETALELLGEYFKTAEQADITGSGFENDLMEWLQKTGSISSKAHAESLFSTWAMALKYEKLVYAEAAEKAAAESELESFLNISREDGLDRAAAEDLLRGNWRDAYNEVQNYTGENRALFDFYKLLDRTGIMQVKINSSAGRSAESFDMLAREESIIAANDYMAEKYKQNADDLIVASVPLFAMSAIYWAAGISALSVPIVGWIQAAVLFATAASMTLGGACLVSEGNAKHAAAEDIQKRIIAPAENRIDTFVEDFKLSKSTILDKQEDYKTEFEVLVKLEGNQSGVSVPSDEQLVDSLKQSVISALAVKGDNLYDFLIDSGVISPESSSEDAQKVLDDLFLKYKQLIENNDEYEYSSPGSLLIALERAAQKANEDSFNELDLYVNGINGIAGKQAESENEYSAVKEMFFDDEASEEELKNAAGKTWGNRAYSEREHLLRLYEEQNRILQIILNSGSGDAGSAAELLTDQKMLLEKIYEQKRENYRSVRLNEFELMKFDLDEKIKFWKSQMRAITAAADLEWKRSRNKFSRMYEDWKTEIKNNYSAQKACWQERYDDFVSDKHQWLDSVTVQSADIGNFESLKDFGKMTKASIAAAGNDIIVFNDDYNPENADKILESIIDFNKLDNLLEKSLNYSYSNNFLAPVLYSGGFKTEFTTVETLEGVRNFQNLQNEEFKKHLAEIDFRTTAEQVGYAEEKLINSIKAANNNVEENLNRMLRDNGYVKKGGRYQKQLLSGSALNETYIYEDGYVSTYSEYSPGNINFSNEITKAGSMAKAMDSFGLKQLVNNIIADINTLMNQIFGKDHEANEKLIAELGLSAVYCDSDNSYTVQRTELGSEKDPGIIQSVINTVEGFFGSGQKSPVETESGSVRLSPGLFGAHVGYAPEFSSKADLNREWNAEGQLKYEGLGEMGRIMGEFVFNSMIEAAGWAELNQPHYRKRIWNDSDSWIKAPDMASVVGMAVNIFTLGAGSGLGTLATAAVNLSDDLILSAFDAGTETRTILEGLVDFGKKAAVSFAGAGASELFGGIELDTDELTEEILLNTSEAAVNNAAAGAVNALDYNTERGWSFNYDLFGAGILGEKAIAGYAGNVCGSAAGSLLGGLADDVLTPIESSYYGELVNLGGSAATLAAEYGTHLAYSLADSGATDGADSFGSAFDKMDMQLNIVDAGSILNAMRLSGTVFADNYNDRFLSGLDEAAFRLKGTGLFALGLNSSGINGEISSNGTNIGSQLYSLGKGFIADTAVNKYGNSHQGANLLENGYAFGDRAMEDTVWRILAGKDELYFDLAQHAGETILRANGGRAIHLRSSYEDSNNEQLNSASIVLQHEAHRDGITDVYNDEETMRAVRAHTEMALGLGLAYGIDTFSGNEELAADIAAYITGIRGSGSPSDAYASYVDASYDSSADYWKLLDDGNIVWDGKKDLVNEAGETLRIDKTGSFSKSLVAWFGNDNARQLLLSRGIDAECMTDSELAAQLMLSSGVEWDAGAFSSTTGRYTGAYIPAGLKEGSLYYGVGLTDLLKFKLDDEQAFHLGKISQESPDIAYYTGGSDNPVNAMAATGCYYLSTLGAVQTQAGKLLTADQINRITAESLENGWLKTDDVSIWTNGADARGSISNLAFQELSQFGFLDFNSESKMLDGSLIVGQTINGNHHAREGNFKMNSEIFDPYEGVSYDPGHEIIANESNYYKYYDYQNYYWKEIEEYYENLW